MGTKFLMMTIAMVAFLLLGCAGISQQPAQNAPAISERTGASVENPAAPPATAAQPAATPQKRHTCSLTLTPSTINAGSSTQVDFAVQTGDKVAFTYNCGNEILGISTGGLTSGFRLCQFNTPGSVDVWIKADGVVCAQKTLIVQQPQTTKTCYINQDSVKRDLVNYNYEARVQFTGFSPQDQIAWVCDHTTTRQTLGGGGAAMGMPLYSDIYCDFKGKPENDAITVSVGDVPCGSISTR